MRIGIVTYWNSSDNYGQQLQCYALQRFLKDQGHDAFLIKYSSKEVYQSAFKVHKFFEYIRHFSTYLKYANQLWQRKLYAKSFDCSARKFSEFRDKYIRSSSHIFDEETILSSTPMADAYICGSDQIWGSHDSVYYLSFAPKGSIKIAYAPSFGGQSEFDDTYAANLRTLLKDFSLITMRERSGVKTLEQLGISGAIQAIDPTLLLSRNDYIDLIDTTVEAKDVFVYLLGSPIVCSVKDIFHYIKHSFQSYHYVVSQGRNDVAKRSEELTIPQWIDGIRKSKLVITNSFHCVVFALMFHRPFIFIPLSGTFSRMNDRLYDILDICGLTSQIYQGDFKALPTTVSFDLFDKMQEYEKDKSLSILNKAISAKPLLLGKSI